MIVNYATDRDGGKQYRENFDQITWHKPCGPRFDLETLENEGGMILTEKKQTSKKKETKSKQ